MNIQEYSRVLYYTPKIYAEYYIGAIFQHETNGLFQVVSVKMRRDLGSYFEITYMPIKPHQKT